MTPHPGESRWGDDPRPEPGDTDQQTAAEVAWLLPKGTDQAGWEATVKAIAAALAGVRADERGRYGALVAAALAAARREGEAAARADGDRLRERVEAVLERLSTLQARVVVRASQSEGAHRIKEAGRAAGYGAAVEEIRAALDGER